VEIIRAAALKEQRWRNGGGVTRELAAGDAGADGLPGWRLSLADITSDGSFSQYPGVDRIFTIVDGDVAFLTVDGSQHRMERYRPFRFDGGSSTDCSLPTGPCRALNVMTRRGDWGAGLLIVELSKKQPLRLADGQYLVLLQGQAQAAADDTAQPLDPYDTVVVSGAAEVSGRGFAALVSVYPAGD
jgi:environmental stress-induced protein Ves